jgi:hypothetical protein
VSLQCPRVYVDDLVTWQGVRGLVDREYSAYDPEKRWKGWHLVLLETGLRVWLSPELLKARQLRAEFIGMPNEDHFPLFGQPLTLWQTIPHEFDEYLTHNMNAGCMFCGLPYGADVHIDADRGKAAE